MAASLAILPATQPSSSWPSHPTFREETSPSYHHNQNNLVYRQLNAAHDTFLSRQGAFIGRLHSGSRFPADLVVTIQQSVTACDHLLWIVEAVCDRDVLNKALKQARDSMFTKMTALVKLAKEKLRLRSAMMPDDSEVLTYEHMEALTCAVAHCVKAAGECVRQAQLTIDRIGDFSLERAQVDDLNISDLVSSFPAPARMKKREQYDDPFLLSESRRQDTQHSTASYQSQSVLDSPEKLSFCGTNFPSFNEGHSVEHMEGCRRGSEGRRPSDPSPEGTYLFGLSSKERSYKRMQGPSGIPDAELGLKRTYENVFFPGQHSISQTERPPKRHHFSRPYLTPISTNSSSWLLQETMESSRGSAATNSIGGTESTIGVVTSALANATLTDDDLGLASAGTHKTSFSSLREFDLNDDISGQSTGLTTPEPQPLGSPTAATSLKPHPSHNTAESQAAFGNDGMETKDSLLEETQELLYGKDGQIIGGTLCALVERLTTHDSTPDSVFVSTFYLTFRQFTTAVELANALVNRFRSVSGNASFAATVQLRVANVFKNWLESYWRQDHDGAALPVISRFAIEELQQVLPGVGGRLVALATKVSAASSPSVPRQLSSLGKTNITMTQHSHPDYLVPNHALSNSQSIASRHWKQVGHRIHILDIDPLELARQLTLETSRLFGSVMPEELLAKEWSKKADSIAINVRAMIKSATYLTFWVSESILTCEDVKRRSMILKHWVKVANFCLELNNYDSLMAIMGALDSASIVRMKKTWDCLPAKIKAIMDTLKPVVATSRNYAVLRQHQQTDCLPCVPFLGIYLTDLTFTDAGNPATRTLSNGTKVINFDKYLKTAKLIGDLQRFQQQPYPLWPVQELQAWIGSHLSRMATISSSIQNGEEGIQDQHYTRSLYLEPR